MILQELAERVDDPKDLCECGDWRMHHRDGKGPCTFNSREFDMCHGGMDCMSFRLASTKPGEGV